MHTHPYRWRNNHLTTETVTTPPQTQDSGSYRLSHAHTQAFPSGQGQTRDLHSNISERYKYLFLSRHQPQPMASPTFCTPTFQSFIALRQEFRVKSFSLNPNLLHVEHYCNVKAGEVCAFSHLCAHTYNAPSNIQIITNNLAPPPNNLFCT